MSPERRRGSVFIGAVLLLQLALPISYYAEGRTFDERFACAGGLRLSAHGPLPGAG